MFRDLGNSMTSNLKRSIDNKLFEVSTHFLIYLVSSMLAAYWNFAIKAINPQLYFYRLEVIANQEFLSLNVLLSPLVSFMALYSTNNIKSQHYPVRQTSEQVIVFHQHMLNDANCSSIMLLNTRPSKQQGPIINLTISR